MTQGLILWDWRVVLDLYLGGIGVGAFLLAALLFYWNSEKYRPIVQTAAVAAPVLVASGLLFLLLEIGKPFRAVLTLVYVNPTSFMSLGVFLQVGFLLLAALFAWRMITAYEAAVYNRPLLIAAAVFALNVGIYHGSLLSGIGREPWNEGLPIIFFLASIASGVIFAWTAALALFGEKAIIARAEGRTVHLGALMAVVLAVLGIALFAWVQGLALRSAESKMMFDFLLGHYGFAFFVLVYGAGILLPIGLFAVNLFKREETPSRNIAYLTAASVLIGMYTLKHIVVYMGQLPYLQ